MFFALRKTPLRHIVVLWDMVLTDTYPVPLLSVLTTAPSVYQSPRKKSPKTANILLLTLTLYKDLILYIHVIKLVFLKK